MSLRPQHRPEHTICPEHGHRLLRTCKTITRYETSKRIIYLCPDERDDVEYEIDA